MYARVWSTHCTFGKAKLPSRLQQSLACAAAKLSLEWYVDLVARLHLNSFRSALPQLVYNTMPARCGCFRDSIFFHALCMFRAVAFELTNMRSPAP